MDYAARVFRNDIDAQEDELSRLGANMGGVASDAGGSVGALWGLVREQDASAFSSAPSSS